MSTTSALDCREHTNEVDITSLLQVELIGRRIFKNVDCFGLLSSRSVSPIWQEVVDHARVWKIVLDKDVKWKKMHNILIQKKTAKAEPVEDSDYDVFYQKLYQQIKLNLELLENNWITNSAYERVNKLPYPGYVERLNFKVKMNEQFIVTRKNPHAIEVFNRWTMASEYIFDIGADNRVMMKSIDLSNEFLAVGCNRGQIFVWCLKTKELLHKLLDDPGLLASESFAQNVMASRVDCTHVRFTPNGKTLFSCISNNSLQYETFTLRKTSNRAMVLIEQQTIQQFNVRQVHIDDSFIYILGADRKGIQVRSIVTLDLVNTIASDTDDFIKSFQPYNKTIILAGRESISVWNIESGMLIRRVSMNSTDRYTKAIGYENLNKFYLRSIQTKTIGLVGDKYIISCHVIGWSSDFYVLGITVWDLPSFIKPSEHPVEGSVMKPLFTYSVSTQFWHDTNIEGVRDSLVEKLKVFIDDYQIGCLLTWEYDYASRETPVPMLYFIDILNQ